MLLPRSARTTLLAGALLALPSTAGAAALAPSGACYLMEPTQGLAMPINATASGLAAGQSVSLRLSRKGVVAGTSPAAAADAAGNLSLSLTAWSLSLGSAPSKEVAGTLEVIDTASGAVVPGASAEVSIANLNYSVSGSRGLRTWKIQGLAALSGNATYYAHYFNNGKYKGRLKIGTGKGACGYLNTKRPLTPFSKIGRYDVVIQASKTYNADLPGFKGSVKVTKRYR